MTQSSVVDPNARTLSPSIPASSFWQWAALAVSLAALAGSLTLSIGLGLKACPLCFYQRTFVMSLVAVLSLGLFTSAGGGSHLGLLALPLAAAGLGIALFHVFLETTGKLECPGGLFEFGTAPQQSLGMFLALFVLLFVDALTATAGKRTGFAAALVLGGLLAVASTTSNPPMPEAPKHPYAKAPDICRPPFRSP